jgi:hypothetical protein
MILELRRYHLIAGGMPSMDRRMEHDLLPMFAKTGVPRPLAIWGGMAAEDTPIMTWMLHWNGFDERRATWATVAPIWQEIKAVRNEAEFVTRTELTLVEPWPGHDLRLEEAGAEMMWHLQPAVGQSGAIRAQCLSEGAEMLAATGARVAFAGDLVFGALPQARLIASWADADARDAALPKLSATGHDRKSLEHQRWEPLDRKTYL